MQDYVAQPMPGRSQTLFDLHDISAASGSWKSAKKERSTFLRESVTTSHTSANPPAPSRFVSFQLLPSCSTCKPLVKDASLRPIWYIARTAKPSRSWPLPLPIVAPLEQYQSIAYASTMLLLHICIPKEKQIHLDAFPASVYPDRKEVSEALDKPKIETGR